MKQISTLSFFLFCVVNVFALQIFLPIFLPNQVLGQSKKLKKQYETAKLAFQNQKYTEATTLFQTILLSKDKKTEIIFQNSTYYLALIYLQEKRFTNAQEQFKTFISKYPNNPAKNEAHFHLADLAFKFFEENKSPENVAEAFQQLNSIQDPNFSENIYQMKGSYLGKLSTKELKPFLTYKDTLIQKMYLHKWASELETLEEMQEMEKFAKENNLVIPEKRKILGARNTRAKYRFAMIMPFENEKIKKRDSSNVAKISFQMYQGMRLAQKEIEKDSTGNNPKVELLAYEVNKDQSEKLDNLLKSPEIQNTDVIFGSVFDNFFMKIAQQAQAKQIYAVSPLSVQDSLLKNDFSYTYYPTQSTMMQRVANFAHKKVALKTTIILYDNLPKSKILANLYKQSCEKLGISVLAFEQINSTEKEKIKTILEKQEATNIGSIYFNTTSQALAVELMFQIGEKKLAFPVLVPDVWLRFQDVSFETLEKNKVHFFQHDYTDMENAKANLFKLNYFKLSKKMPTQYAYMGYEMFYFWYEVMKKLGTKRNLKTDFEKFPVQDGVITPKIDLRNGKSNQFVPLLKMDKDKLVIVED